MDEYSGRVHRVDSFVDTWTIVHEEEAGEATWIRPPDYPGQGDRRLDYCFVSPPLVERVSNAWVDCEAQVQIISLTGSRSICEARGKLRLRGLARIDRAKYSGGRLDCPRRVKRERLSQVRSRLLPFAKVCQTTRYNKCGKYTKGKNETELASDPQRQEIGLFINSADEHQADHGQAVENNGVDQQR